MGLNPNTGKIFLRNNSQNNLYLISMILGTAAFLFSMTIGVSGGASLLLVVIFSAILYFSKDKPVMSIEGDHVVIKPTPLTPTVRILFSDIENIEEGDKVFSLILSNKPKPFCIANALFSSEDLYNIITIFKNIAAKNNPISSTAIKEEICEFLQHANEH